MADEYIKIAIAAADQKKKDENLASQEIARTTTPPHCLTCSVCTTHLPSQLVSINFNTASLRIAGKFYRSLWHLLARGSIHGRALPFLAPLFEIYKSLSITALAKIQSALQSSQEFIVEKNFVHPHTWYMEKCEFQQLTASSVFSSRVCCHKSFHNRARSRTARRSHGTVMRDDEIRVASWRKEGTTSPSTTPVLDWMPSDWTSVVFDDESSRACAYAAVTYIATKHVLCTYVWRIVRKTVRTCIRTHCESRCKV